MSQQESISNSSSTPISRLSRHLKPVPSRPLPASTSHEFYWVDPADRPALEALGFSHASAWLDHPPGRLLRTVQGRENWYIKFPAALGTKGAYLKRHREMQPIWMQLLLSSLEKILLWTGWNEPSQTPPKFSRGLNYAPSQTTFTTTAGRMEAENILRLQSHDIPTMRLICCGERSIPGGSESFVMTEELTGYQQLDHYLRQHFPPVADARPNDLAKLRRLIEAVAVVARQFHLAGFNHRDFYACHFFIKIMPDQTYDVRLIDLQRVQARQRFRRRWLVKDLAQLAYSTPKEQVGCKQRLQFFKSYLGVRKLNTEARQLLRQILSKQSWMQWRQGSY